MEFSVILASLVALVSHATVNPRSEDRRPVPLIHLQRLSLVALAAREASQAVLCLCKERQSPPEALGRIPLSPAGSSACRRARKALDRKHGLCTCLRTRQYPVRGPE